MITIATQCYNTHDIYCEQDLSKYIECEYVSVSGGDRSYFKEFHLNKGQIGGIITQSKIWTVLVYENPFASTL